MLSPDGDKDKDPLLINLLEEGQDIVSNLHHLNLSPQSCYRSSEPINLYHKVGHGTLNMYVLSPAKDSKEVKDFMQKWNNNDQKLFTNSKHTKEFVFPVPNLVSICALLVWQPANPNDTITRILYPGSTPQHKIFEGMEKIKHLSCVKHPVCSESSLTPSISITALKSKPLIEKIMLPEHKITKKLGETKLKEKQNREIVTKPKTENKIGDNTVDASNVKSDACDGEKLISKINKQKKGVESTTVTEKTEEKTNEKKRQTEAKPSKVKQDLQLRKTKPLEKKASPTTPKKTLDAKLNGEVKAKPTGKSSPQVTAPKSAKEANNRKVLELKQRQTKQQTQHFDKKEVKSEKKAVSRRPKEIVGPKPPGSPLKKLNGITKPDSISHRGKFDKEGTTDSSTVSTPSADHECSLKKDISKLTPEEIEQLKAQELADLKEEQEVVKEIEAVFRKGELRDEKSSDIRIIKDLSSDKEPEEYLIIEREIIESKVIETRQEQEYEMQKHVKDTEESEKLKKVDKEILEHGSCDTQHENIKRREDTSAEEKKNEVFNEQNEKEHIATHKDSSGTSPEEKLDTHSEKKTNGRGDTEECNKDIVDPNNALESQPDEKVSGTIESGATTAPTLPEDERIPLDEIKEDNGDQIVEEKYVKEDTKEKEIPLIQLPPKPLDIASKPPHVVGIKFDKQSNIRDLVKTPDEVADLPVHEEVDVQNYDYQSEYKNDTSTADMRLPEERYTEIGSKVDHKEKIEYAKQDSNLNKEEKIDEQKKESDFSTTGGKESYLQESVVELPITQTKDKDDNLPSASVDIPIDSAHTGVAKIESKIIESKEITSPIDLKIQLQSTQKTDMMDQSDKKCDVTDIHAELALHETKSDENKISVSSTTDFKLETTQEHEKEHKPIPDKEDDVDHNEDKATLDATEFTEKNECILPKADFAKDSIPLSKELNIVQKPSEVKKVLIEDHSKIPPVQQKLDINTERDRKPADSNKTDIGSLDTFSLNSAADTIILREEVDNKQQDSVESVKLEHEREQVEEKLEDRPKLSDVNKLDESAFLEKNLAQDYHAGVETAPPKIEDKLMTQEINKESVCSSKAEQSYDHEVNKICGTDIKGFSAKKCEPTLDKPEGELLEVELQLTGAENTNMSKIQAGELPHQGLLDQSSEETSGDKLSSVSTEKLEEPVQTANVIEKEKQELHEKTSDSKNEQEVAKINILIDAQNKSTSSVDTEIVTDVSVDIKAINVKADTQKDVFVQEVQNEKGDLPYLADIEENMEKREDIEIKTTPETVLPEKLQDKDLNVGQDIKSEGLCIKDEELKTDDVSLKAGNDNASHHVTGKMDIVNTQQNEPGLIAEEIAVQKKVDDVNNHTVSEIQSIKLLEQNIDVNKTDHTLEETNGNLRESIKKDSLKSIEEITPINVDNVKYGDQEKQSVSVDTVYTQEIKVVEDKISVDIDKSNIEKVVPDIVDKDFTKDSAVVLIPLKEKELKRVESSEAHSLKSEIDSVTSEIGETSEEISVQDKTQESGLTVLASDKTTSKETKHVSPIDDKFETEKLSKEVEFSSETDVCVGKENQLVISKQEKDVGKSLSDVITKEPIIDVTSIDETEEHIVSNVKGDTKMAKSGLEQVLSSKTEQSPKTIQMDEDNKIGNYTLDNKDGIQHEAVNLTVDDKGAITTETQQKILVESVLRDTHCVAELDNKLQEMKSKTGHSEFSDFREGFVETNKLEKVAHPEPVIISSDSAPESPLSPTGGKQITPIDKASLGSKSPKEREEDVAKIVASVAEVLKSDAPLEEFEGKVPLKTITPFTPFTTELRETHITLVESPITEELKQDNGDQKSLITSFIEEEKKISSIHIDELHESNKNAIDPEEQKVDPQENEPGTVHRMLVTASSEDGGEETVICPVGSIMFSRSSESSGRSTPDVIFTEDTISRKHSDVGESKRLISEPVGTSDSEKRTEIIEHPATDVSTARQDFSEDNKVVSENLSHADTNSSKAGEKSTISSEVKGTTLLQKTEAIALVKEEEHEENKEVIPHLSHATGLILTYQDEADEDDNTYKIAKVTNEIRKSEEKFVDFKPSMASRSSEVVGDAPSDRSDSAKHEHDDLPTKLNAGDETVDGKLITEEGVPKEKTQHITSVPDTSQKEDQTIEGHADQQKTNSVLFGQNLTDIVVTEKVTIQSDDKKHETHEQIKSDIKDLAQYTVIMDTAGPSNIARKDSLTKQLSQSKTSIDNLSGKSTPDIADVEKLKEMQDILKHEKHIPGTSTPPTVPVSPIIQEHGSPERDTGSDENVKFAFDEAKKIVETTIITSAEDVELGTYISDKEISSGKVVKGSNVYESRDESDDEELPGSPASLTSHVAHSPSSHYDFKDGSDKFASKMDTMNLSFYGTLPGDQIETDKTHAFLDEADVDFEKAMQEHRQTRGEDLDKGPISSYLYEVTTAKYSTTQAIAEVEMKKKHSGEIPSVLKGQDLMSSSFIGSELATSSNVELKDDKDPVSSWGKPLGLPSPLPPNDNKGTPKKERKLPSNISAKNKLNDDKRQSESPSKQERKQKKLNWIYVDLTYVPHYGNSNYSYIDFFKRVRARYYVFSGIEPSKEVYNALLEAKQTWEDKELGKYLPNNKCTNIIVIISRDGISGNYYLPIFLHLLAKIFEFYR